MTKWFGGISLLIAALVCAQGAGAQEVPHEVAVAVPGLRAVDGDDDVANELTGWLRAGASAVEGWQLHTAMVSLEQVLIVHGCDEANEDCLSKIAAGLKADRLISGSVSRVRAGDGDGYDFEADLFYFDASTGKIEKTSTVRFPKTRSTPQELAALDAKRSINMIKKMNLNVFGIVENMSGGIFGTGAGEELAQEMDLPFLGRVTMRAEFLDPKQPAVLESDAVADEFSEIAIKLRQIAQSAV